MLAHAKPWVKAGWGQNGRDVPGIRSPVLLSTSSALWKEIPQGSTVENTPGCHCQPKRVHRPCAPSWRSRKIRPVRRSPNQVRSELPSQYGEVGGKRPCRCGPSRQRGLRRADSCRWCGSQTRVSGAGGTSPADRYREAGDARVGYTLAEVRADGLGQRRLARGRFAVAQEEDDRLATPLLQTVRRTVRGPPSGL